MAIDRCGWFYGVTNPHSLAVVNPPYAPDIMLDAVNHIEALHRLAQSDGGNAPIAVLAVVPTRVSRLLHQITS